MKKGAISLLFFVIGRVWGVEPLSFATWFEDKTIRVDYLHIGMAQEESFAFEAAFIESPWAGPRHLLIDPLDRGKYRFRVHDEESGLLLFSRGFCSIFGEWETTREAQDERRTFSESLRFPLPKRPVRIFLDKRDENNHLKPCWSFFLDPAQVQDLSGVHTQWPLRALHQGGDLFDHLDLLFLPDGYTASEMEKFTQDALRLMEILFATPPFASRRSDFNVWILEVPSQESGIDDPTSGIIRENRLGCRFNTFGSERYILTEENRTLRDIASHAPYDFLCILIHSEKYGGGGIYNLYATCVSDNVWSDYIFIHELGHTLAGLADEYYTSEVSYQDFYPKGVEPWEPNITALLDTKQLKWMDLVDPGTPIPTPWDKARFDSANTAYWQLRTAMPSKTDSLREAHDRWVHDFFLHQPYRNKVGAFEGCGYVSEGFYRPSLDCRMFSRSMTGFDPVCSRAIDQVIDFYTDQWEKESTR